METREQRVAENESRFRAANEEIEEVASHLERTGHDRGPELMPVICECGNRGCTTVIRLTFEEYEELRSDPAHFAIVPGHEGASAEEKVVETSDRFAVVEKVGESRRIVEETDPRS